MGRTKDSGTQDLSLEMPGCVDQGVVIHELLHALGFVHEQTRPDRDKYVKIYFENIQAGIAIDFTRFTKNKMLVLFLGQEHNFQRYAIADVNTFGEAYDYGKYVH